jgi:hypothetical protein
VLCWGGGGRGAGRGGRGARACVRACVRACTRRLTCPLLPNVNSKAPLTHTSNKHNAMGVSVPVPVPVILRDYHLVTCTTRAPFLYFLLSTRPVGCETQRLSSLWRLSREPGTGELTYQPGQCAGGLGYRAFSLSTRIEESPHVGAGAAPPPSPPPRPASGSHRLPNTLGQVGEQYEPSIAPFPICVIGAHFYHSPLISYKAKFPRRGSARIAHGPISVFRTSTSHAVATCIAPVLGVGVGHAPTRTYLTKYLTGLGLGYGRWESLL